MPVHPVEEEAPGNLTDKVAQDSKDSTASDHPIHNENKGAYENSKPGESGGVSAFQSKGPQIPDDKDLPPIRSKEELEAESKRLNS